MRKRANNRTFMLTKEQAHASKKWILIDAAGKTMGRLASNVAKILRGKHRVDYTPHVDCGDGVVIVNAQQAVLTGNKEGQKVYWRYTGSIGGKRVTPYRTMQDRKPTYPLYHAIKSMMPKTKLSRAQLKHLRIFKDDQHNMGAANPIQVGAIGE